MNSVYYCPSKLTQKPVYEKRISVNTAVAHVETVSFYSTYKPPRSLISPGVISGSLRYFANNCLLVSFVRLFVGVDSQTFKMGSYSCCSHNVHRGGQVWRRRCDTKYNLCLKELVTLFSRHFKSPPSIRASVTPSRSVFWSFTLIHFFIEFCFDFNLIHFCRPNNYYIA